MKKQDVILNHLNQIDAKSKKIKEIMESMK